MTCATAPTLQSDRLRLRALQEADFETYRRFYADGEASHFYGGPLRPDEAWKRLAQHVGHWALRGYGLWAVEELASGTMLGGCGLAWPGGWPRPELTWWFLPEARGRGYATEASGAVIDWAIWVAGWASVETHMDDRNEAARRLAVRLGGRVVARERFPDGKERDVFLLRAAG